MYCKWFLLMIVYYDLVNGKDLDFCNVNPNITKLCKKFADYRANLTPRPWPTIIIPTVDLKSVIDVDENKKTMTVYLFLVTCWFDHEISVSKNYSVVTDNPEEKE